MVTKRTVDRIGGVGSILIGIGCAWMGFRDWQMEHSLWKVEAVMFVLLVLNGVAMIRYSLLKGAARYKGGGMGDGVMRGSTRV